MHPGYHLAPFFPAGCPLLLFGEVAMGVGQGPFLFSKEARICYLLSGREIGKRFEADIDTDPLI
jgi:hypothetical protein